jgi:hypothetical protein
VLKNFSSKAIEKKEGGRERERKDKVKKQKKKKKLLKVIKENKN